MQSAIEVAPRTAIPAATNAAKSHSPDVTSHSTSSAQPSTSGSSAQPSTSGSSAQPSTSGSSAQPSTSGSSAQPSGDQAPVSRGDVRIGPPSVNQEYTIEVKDMKYDANGLHGQIIVNGKTYQYAGDGKEPTPIMGGGTSDAQKRKSQKRRPE